VGFRLGRVSEGDEILTPVARRDMLCLVNGAPSASQERGSAWRRRVEVVYAALQDPILLEGRSVFETRGPTSPPFPAQVHRKKLRSRAVLGHWPGLSTCSVTQISDPGLRMSAMSTITIEVR
jgi:hypothetical protein